jgi:hypothetical protein
VTHTPAAGPLLAHGSIVARNHMCRGHAYLAARTVIEHDARQEIRSQLAAAGLVPPALADMPATWVRVLDEDTTDTPADDTGEEITAARARALPRIAAALDIPASALPDDRPRHAPGTRWREEPVTDATVVDDEDLLILRVQGLVERAADGRTVLDPVAGISDQR